MRFNGKLFCDINPTTYWISEQKEILKRHIKNILSKEKFASSKSAEPLDALIYEKYSGLIKRGPGIEPELQENKAVNIRLASKQLDGILICPGETFSFWHTVGKTTKRRGYRDGRVIIADRLTPGMGGGLCNLSNTIHLMILHSPLTVTEFHFHSDALAPDEGKRVPLSTGTSVSYNNIDYRVRNDTDSVYQLRLWVEGEALYGELRADKDIPYAYEIEEEDHRFRKEGEKIYRCSKIYRRTVDKATGETVGRELLIDNHSEVLYDYALVPKELIRE